MSKLKNLAKIITVLNLAVMVLGSAYIWLGPGLHMTYGEVFVEYWEFFTVSTIVGVVSTSLCSK